MAVGNLTEEYNDVSRNIRHYSNLRFIQFILYILCTAGLITFLLLQLSSGNWLRLCLKIIGIVISVFFGLMEKQAADIVQYLFRRAVEIEELLGFKQYTNYPAGRLLKIVDAVRLIIWGGTLLWLLAVIFSL